MQKVKSVFSSAKIAAAGVMLTAAAALGAALTGQHAFGLQPCTLCIYQRIPYVLVFLLGLGALAAAWRGKQKAAAGLVALAAPVFLAGAGIAFYHHGVEQHWWASFLEGCKVTLAAENTDLMAQIMGAQPARCDEIPWADPLFGLSMAAWNMILSPVFAALSLLSGIMITRKANGF